MAMDAWALNIKTGAFSFAAAKRDEGAVTGFGSGRVLDLGSRRVSLAYRALVVTAAGKKKNHDNTSSSGNNDPSFPEEDGPEGVNPAYDKSKSDDVTQKSHQTLLGWRDFRADLVARSHRLPRSLAITINCPPWIHLELLDSADPTDEHKSSHKLPSQRIGPKWAHPIPFPEPGCVLVATEKLDGVRSFERTVVLLLRLGTMDPREGPFGVIINRPFDKKMKNMYPTNTELATTFSDCSLYFGGPLDTSMFLIKTSENSPVRGFEQVVPGICFGARNSLEEAAALVKKGKLRAEDFKFFVGYAGWQLDQLREEIESDYWVVAACSSHLIGSVASANSEGLWEEILQLMGGQYSELSRKPKQDSSS